MSRYKQHKQDGWLRNHSFDYGYLAKLWNLDTEEPYCRWYDNDLKQDADVKAIQEFLQAVNKEHFSVCESWMESCVCKQKKVASDLRKYLKELGKDNKYHYEAGVWRAMSKIKNDYSLLRLVYPLIGYMWS